MFFGPLIPPDLEFAMNHLRRQLYTGQITLQDAHKRCEDIVAEFYAPFDAGATIRRWSQELVVAKCVADPATRIIDFDNKAQAAIAAGVESVETRC